MNDCLPSKLLFRIVIEFQVNLVSEWRRIVMKDSTDSSKYTAAGTNIDEVKRQNANSGLSYNEAMELIAKTGGIGTHSFKDTKDTKL